MENYYNHAVNKLSHYLNTHKAIHKAIHLGVGGLLDSPRLSDYSYTNSDVVRQSLLLHYIDALCDYFTRHGLHIVILKGLPYTYELFGDLCLRYSSDIDILCEKGQFKQICHCLKEIGYIYQGGDSYSDYDSYVNNDPLLNNGFNHGKEYISPRGSLRYNLELHFYPFAKTHHCYGPEAYSDIDTRFFFH